MKTNGNWSRSAFRLVGVLAMLAIGLLPATFSGSAVAAYTSGGSTPNKFGELDCNGQSRVEHPVRPNMLCTDIRGFRQVDNANTWGGRFYDNGMYIGHDEPDMTFLSTQKGSGGNVSWTETLPRDPVANPTVADPGNDVAHWFELSAAPWFSMAICDPNSYPQLPCKPNSDANAPGCPNPFNCPNNTYPGGGSAFMEMQFYPPGMAPFADAPSCDNAHWCAALNIDSLECTYLYGQCNNNCPEPVNFAFIQTDGVPAGPPSPQYSNLNSFTPNAHTMLLNPGDKLTVHMWDAPTPYGGKAFEVMINDLTTGQKGWMQASAYNGFQNTSMVDCSGSPFDFEPEYNTASKNNITPWAALQTNISTQFEIGHFTPCTSVSQVAVIHLDYGIFDKYWNSCAGPYEDSAAGGDGGNSPEQSDALCYPKGDTHGILQSDPNLVSGCLNDWLQNGDLDFDGSGYWPEWPTSATRTGALPSSFVQNLPVSGGKQYSQFFFQTDTALSESTCSYSNRKKGCAVPPPNAPGKFYPYFSEVQGSSDTCTIEFGNVSSGAGVKSFGRYNQYSPDRYSTAGYPEFESQTYNNTCPGTVATSARKPIHKKA